MTTLLVPPETLALDSLTLTGEKFRHLFRASRLAEGDELRAVDGLGAARWARVASVSRREAELQLGEPAPANEPSRRVELFVAPPKIGRASWMVEKLTEIGHRGDGPHPGETPPAATGRSSDHVRYEELVRLLDANGGSVARAASVLGVHRSTVYRWLQSRERTANSAKGG